LKRRIDFLTVGMNSDCRGEPQYAQNPRKTVVLTYLYWVAHKDILNVISSSLFKVSRMQHIHKSITVFIQHRSWTESE